MKKNILKNLICFLIIFIFLYFYIFTPFPAQAGVFEEITKNLGEFNTGAGLPVHPSDDILPIIIGIVNVILTFLALLFIIMILYAGFLYLTAGGSPDKSKKAIGIIRDSVIGVVIVVLSGVFVNYILVQIIEVIR